MSIHTSHTDQQTGTTSTGKRDASHLGLATTIAGDHKKAANGLATQIGYSTPHQAGYQGVSYRNHVSIMIDRPMIPFGGACNRENIARFLRGELSDLPQHDRYILIFCINYGRQNAWMKREWPKKRRTAFVAIVQAMHAFRANDWTWEEINTVNFMNVPRIAPQELRDLFMISTNGTTITPSLEAVMIENKIGY